MRTNGAQRAAPERPDEPPQVDPAQAEIVQRCESIVEDFRRGNATKIRAIRLLADELRKGPLAGNEEPFQQEQALQVYYDMLTEHEQDNADAQRRGEEEAAARGGVQRPERQEAEQQEDAHQPAEQHERGRRPRAASFFGDDDGSQADPNDDGNDEEGDGPNKRPRVDEAAYPWAPVGEIARAILHPDLQRTLELIDTYTLDIRTAKRSFLNNAACPDFPDSEVTNLLSGKAVNLDAIFAATHSTTINEVETHTLSERISIRLTDGTSSADLKRAIKTAAEWSSTWRTYSKAVIIAFPHRVEELDAYHDYITSLFGSQVVDFHPRIFALDKAVRGRVGRRRDIMLSDILKFADLERSHLTLSGIAYSEFSGDRGKKKGADRARTSQDACHRWNAGHCPSSAAKCRYRHVCSICRGGHTSDKHPAGSS